MTRFDFYNYSKSSLDDFQIEPPLSLDQYARMKNNTYANVHVDPISNVCLTITGSRRSLKISKKKIHNPPLVPKTCFNKKTKMLVLVSIHQVT